MPGLGRASDWQELSSGGFWPWLHARANWVVQIGRMEAIGRCLIWAAHASKAIAGLTLRCTDLRQKPRGPVNSDAGITVKGS